MSIVEEIKEAFKFKRFEIEEFDSLDEEIEFNNKWIDFKAKKDHPESDIEISEIVVWTEEGEEIELSEDQYDKVYDEILTSIIYNELY